MTGKKVFRGLERTYNNYNSSSRGNGGLFLTSVNNSLSNQDGSFKSLCLLRLIGVEAGRRCSRRQFTRVNIDFMLPNSIWEEAVYHVPKTVSMHPGDAYETLKIYINKEHKSTLHISGMHVCFFVFLIKMRYFKLLVMLHSASQLLLYFIRIEYFI